MIIRPFENDERQTVIKLWRRCGLVVAWNDPEADIDRKLRVDPELFVVGIAGSRLVATAMGGYDGHRGSLYYLAVDAQHQGRGYGRKIAYFLADLLEQRGCPKLNIMVRSSNTRMIDFYHRLGFKTDEVVCLGKRLIEDD